MLPPPHLPDVGVPLRWSSIRPGDVQTWVERLSVDEPGFRASAPGETRRQRSPSLRCGGAADTCLALGGGWSSAAFVPESEAARGQAELRQDPADVVLDGALRQGDCRAIAALLIPRDQCCHLGLARVSTGPPRLTEQRVELVDQRRHAERCASSRAPWACSRRARERVGSTAASSASTYAFDGRAWTSRPGQRGPQMLVCRGQVAEHASQAAENEADGALACGREGSCIGVRTAGGWCTASPRCLVTQPGADVAPSAIAIKNSGASTGTAATWAASARHSSAASALGRHS